MSYEVHLEVYDGPFELLLTLISERRVDVCDVPIARLTEEYLAHLERMHEVDLEVATEFLVVAATLLQLKARALLPGGDEEAAIEDDVERDVLIARLLEVRTFQSVGALLADRLSDGDTRYPPAPAPDDPSLKVLPTLAGIAAADLARAFVQMVSGRDRPLDTSTLLSDEISSEEASSLLARVLQQGPATFRTVVRGLSLSWAVAVFLAMLELAMRGEAELGQAERLGEIEIRPRHERSGAR